MHFYFNQGFPVFLLTCFGKNEKSNLTKSERNTLHAGIQILKEGTQKEGCDPEMVAADLRMDNSNVYGCT